jgi:hypothetical protein
MKESAQNVQTLESKNGEKIILKRGLPTEKNTGKKIKKD